MSTETKPQQLEEKGETDPLGHQNSKQAFDTWIEGSCLSKLIDHLDDDDERKAMLRVFFSKDTEEPLETLLKSAREHTSFIVYELKDFLATQGVDTESERCNLCFSPMYIWGEKSFHVDSMCLWEWAK